MGRQLPPLLPAPLPAPSLWAWARERPWATGTALRTDKAGHRTSGGSGEVGGQKIVVGAEGGAARSLVLPSSCCCQTPKPVSGPRVAPLSLSHRTSRTRALAGADTGKRQQRSAALTWAGPQEGGVCHIALEALKGDVGCVLGREGPTKLGVAPHQDAATEQCKGTG